MRTFGIYAGSFNPFHVGHLNILHKAQAICDEVILARGSNPDKVIPKVEGIEPIGFLRYKQGVEFYEYEGATTDFLRRFEQTCRKIVLIRGLRDANDYEHEIRQVRWMQAMYPRLNVVFIPCDAEFSHVSSSDIRKVGLLDPELAAKYKV